jgi:hypothetical protein
MALVKVFSLASAVFYLTDAHTSILSDPVIDIAFWGPHLPAWTMRSKISFSGLGFFAILTFRSSHSPDRYALDESDNYRYQVSLRDQEGAVFCNGE